MPVQISREQILGDAGLMTAFKQTLEYDTLLRYMNYASEDFTGKLVNFRPDDSQRTDDYHKGVLAGLKIASQIPDNIILSGQRLREDTSLDKLTLR